MSPQILLGTKYTTKSDIWALGLIFYELLYGRTPWTAFSQVDLSNKINSQPVKFPSEIVVSDESKDFIKRCLVIEEKDRISWDQVN